MNLTFFYNKHRPINFYHFRLNTVILFLQKNTLLNGLVHNNKMLLIKSGILLRQLCSRPHKYVPNNKIQTFKNCILNASAMKTKAKLNCT